MADKKKITVKAFEPLNKSFTTKDGSKTFHKYTVTDETGEQWEVSTMETMAVGMELQGQVGEYNGVKQLNFAGKPKQWSGGGGKSIEGSKIEAKATIVAAVLGMFTAGKLERGGIKTTYDFWVKEIGA